MKHHLRLKLFHDRLHDCCVTDIANLVVDAVLQVQLLEEIGTRFRRQGETPEISPKL